MSGSAALLRMHMVSEGNLLSDIHLELGAGYHAILGRGGAGKTELLSLAAGERRPRSGTVQAAEPLVYVSELQERTGGTPQRILRAALRSADMPPDEAGRLLEAFDLWDVRHIAAKHLGQSQLIALRLAAAIATRPKVLLVDCLVDRLPPFVQLGAERELRHLAKTGSLVLIATRVPFVAERADCIIVLERGRVLAQGSLHMLIGECAPDELIVETPDPMGLRGMVEPWCIRVEQTPQGLRLRASDGLEHAARLLREGYGTVQTVIVRRATLEQAWKRLLELHHR